VQAEQTGERGQTAWSDIDWTAAAAAVRRLQGRIYRAAAAGRGRQVKNLPKLLIRSKSAKRLAICWVTQQNAGRTIPGLDGVVCRTPESGRRLAAGRYRPVGQPVTGTPVVAFPCTMGGSGTGRQRLEPDDEQSSRPVLRGPGLGNKARLPDLTALTRLG
jgi:reverse transcriptase-like protein